MGVIKDEVITLVAGQPARPRMMNKIHVEKKIKKKAYHGLTGKDYTQQFYWDNHALN
ncbi:hypothetical protein GCM10007290_13620 [Providencia stuartii]|nr:hypothetical protein GCM10007290_13620 [Providencia thailandensis]